MVFILVLVVTEENVIKINILKVVLEVASVIVWIYFLIGDMLLVIVQPIKKAKIDFHHNLCNKQKKILSCAVCLRLVYSSGEKNLTHGVDKANYIVSETVLEIRTVAF